MDEMKYLDKNLSSEEKKILCTSHSPQYNPAMERLKFNDQMGCIPTIIGNLEDVEQNYNYGVVNQYKSDSFSIENTASDFLKERFYNLEHQINEKEKMMNEILNSWKKDNNYMFPDIEDTFKRWNEYLQQSDELHEHNHNNQRKYDNYMLGNLPIHILQTPKFLDNFTNIKERFENNIPSSIRFYSDPSLSESNSIIKYNDFYDIEYDSNNSLYSQVEIAYNRIKDNIHVCLKPNQVLFIIYDNLVFKITDKNNIKFSCIAGELNPNYKPFRLRWYGYCYYIAKPHFVYNTTQIAIIEYNQYKLLRKSTKELFPSIETFNLNNDNLSKDIDEYISCVYKREYDNEIYLYTYNHANYKYIHLVNLNATHYLTDIPDKYYDKTSDKNKDDNDIYDVCDLYPSSIIKSEHNNRRFESIDRIIEKKEKKPIYSKRRR